MQCVSVCCGVAAIVVSARVCVAAFRLQEIVDLSASNVVLAGQGLKRTAQWGQDILNVLNSLTQVDPLDRFKQARSCSSHERVASPLPA